MYVDSYFRGIKILFVFKMMRSSLTHQGDNGCHVYIL